MNLSRTFAFVTLLSLICATAEARTADGFEGKWVWQVEGRPVFLLSFASSTGEGATLTRPGSIQLGEHGGLRRVSGPIRTEVLESELEIDALRLIGEPLGAPAPRREYLVRLIDDNRLEFRFGVSPQAPAVILYRPHDPTVILTDWGGDRIYGPTVSATPQPPNPALAALFNADQAARAGGPNIDWSIVNVEDRTRREETRRLLEAGQVASADDFYHAAFIFQHGDVADDYLLAHALAVTAIAKGRADAAWIAAASLDRYLQNIGRAQIYGTQFQIPSDDRPVTQGDYNRDLLPDSARIAVGVPDRSGQEEQKQRYEALRAKP